MENATMANLMIIWQDKIPAESVLILQDQLKNIPEDRTAPLMGIQLKSPLIGLILGIFLGVFGIDRFYKGNIGLGIAKLVLTLTYFGIVISFFWSLVDLFLVWKGIKKDNLQKIQSILLALKS